LSEHKRKEFKGESMKTAFYQFVDHIDEIIEKLDKFVQKYAPCFLCFSGGYFLGVIVNTLMHRG